MTVQYYTLSLTFKAPVISQASGTLSFGYDTAMLRADGKPVLGGSLIRGNIREAMYHFTHELQASHFNKTKYINSVVSKWFGKESCNDANTDGFKPNTGKLQFDFYWQLQSPYTQEKDSRRTRIAIDKYGKVKAGALQVIEDCFPLGTNPVFTGTIRAEFNDKKEKSYFERLMKMALDYIPAMGSFKGIGFGKLTHTELTPAKQPEHKKPLALQALALETEQSRIGIEFSIDRPFCLGKPRTPDSNRIISSEIITGNVIKALLAQALGNEQLNSLLFDQWHISHCLPLKAQEADAVKRPSPVIPLSIAKVGKSYKDLHALTLTQATQEAWQEAPSFQPDWKSDDWHNVTKSIGIANTHPQRQLMVRTGINSQAQTAQKGELFSMECVVPKDFIWRGDIDLSPLPKDIRSHAISQLEKALQQGLHGLGKTKAALTSIKATNAFITPTVSDDNIIVNQPLTLTLMTMARLFPLGWERDQQQCNQSAEQLYQQYWQQISEDSLQLVNFFAQQQREGGAYHYYHFQHDKKHSDYAPEWLTVAGSVFVLKVTDAAKAKQKIQQWLTYGLPIPEGSNITWQDSPYLPEHGYGEVLLNWQPLNSNKGHEEQSA